MPKTPIDYKNTVIYVIFANSGDGDTYIGHTTNFTTRKYGHKTCCNNPKGKHYNLKLYKAIRQNGGWDNYTIKIIENYPCDTHNEAAAREFFYFQKYNATLNGYVPSRQKNQYYSDNKPEILQKASEYRNNHKPEISQYNAEYYNNNKTHLLKTTSEYRNNHKSQISKNTVEYYNKNKAHIRQRHTEYQNKNRQKLAEYRHTKIICECGISCSRSNIPEHKRSKKHAKLLQLKTN